MEVTLRILEGAKAGGTVAVKKSEFIIGRSPECHLCAGSNAISRKHCVLTRGENGVTVRDLGSRNGTLVNGERIEGERSLRSGDELIVGPLRFQIGISIGMNNVKRSEVKTVAEAVARAAEPTPGNVGEDDISAWLLGGPSSPAAGFAETQTVQLDDTTIGKLDPATQTTTEAPPADADNEGAPEKHAPAKPRFTQAEPQTKDSREAAAEALRAWSRRR